MNELEWIKGEIWANVWQSDRVARIDPKDGRVVGWIDFSGLLKPEEKMNTDVLNGIAYDSAEGSGVCDGQVMAQGFRSQSGQEVGDSRPRESDLTASRTGSIMKASLRKEVVQSNI